MLCSQQYQERKNKMKKYGRLNLLVIALGIIFFSSRAISENNAIFNPTTYTLHIPEVLVGYDRYDRYEVDMQYNTMDQNFTVTNASIIETDYRQEMRNFVIALSSYAKRYKGNFIIIPQNGQELLTDSGEADGIPQIAYLQFIDAAGRESNGCYGNEKTPTEDEYRKHLLLCEQYNVEVLAIDYCSIPSEIDTSYQLNQQNGFISFSADELNLNSIPAHPEKLYNENESDVAKISQAKNFLYLINSERYATKQDFLNAISATNYDVIVMDLYHNEAIYTANEIEMLKVKQNGGKRLVISYLSIGEAEDYRYYWQEIWNSNKPDWLEPESPIWAGNYKVEYWNTEWQEIIFGNDSSYLKKIIDAGFDGVYLDIIDAFEYFESR